MNSSWGAHRSWWRDQERHERPELGELAFRVHDVGGRRIGGETGGEPIIPVASNDRRVVGAALATLARRFVKLMRASVDLCRAVIRQSPASTNHRTHHISSATALTTAAASPQPIKSGSHQSFTEPPARRKRGAPYPRRSSRCRRLGRNEQHLRGRPSNRAERGGRQRNFHSALTSGNALATDPQPYNEAYRKMTFKKTHSRDFAPFQ
jgi:hypothetical protein